MIPVHNIYYMLSYVFKVLNGQGYRHMAMESFHNVADLCAAILCKGVSLQIKRGLGRSYIEKTEPLSALRGRIDITESMKTQSLLRQQLVCSYDDFSVNTHMNHIIKSTLSLLLQGNIARERKKDIRRLLKYFEGVDVTDVRDYLYHVLMCRRNILQIVRRLIFLSCCLGIRK